MFKGNKLVLILPGILVALMLFGGYYFLENTETATNEDLKNVVELKLEVVETQEGWKVIAVWDWTAMPSDGFYGEDYLSITVEDQTTGHARSDVRFTSSEVGLFHAERSVFEGEGISVENGVIFTFPNELVDNEVVGNRGQASVIVKGEDITSEDITVRLLHTWLVHSPLEKEDAQFRSPSFGEARNVPYWIVEGRIDSES